MIKKYKILLVVDCFSSGGLVSIALVLTLIILQFLKLRKENHMKHRKNRTVISNLKRATAYETTLKSLKEQYVLPKLLTNITKYG